MTMFVSRSKLPLTEVHGLAAFFDCILHASEIVRGYATSESSQVNAGHPLRLNFSEFACKS